MLTLDDLTVSTAEYLPIVLSCSLHTYVSCLLTENNHIEKPQNRACYHTQCRTDQSCRYEVETSFALEPRGPLLKLNGLLLRPC